MDARTKACIARRHGQIILPDSDIGDHHDGLRIAYAGALAQPAAHAEFRIEHGRFVMSGLEGLREGAGPEADSAAAVVVRVA